LLLKWLEVLSSPHRHFEEHLMKSWKAALGLGAACVACCVVPPLGVIAALIAMLALWWQRRRAARNAAVGCQGACALPADKG
jgi:hypothetical protein